MFLERGQDERTAPSDSPLRHFFIYSLLKRDDVEKEQQAKELEHTSQSFILISLLFTHAAFIRLVLFIRCLAEFV